jgi:hypothetical protein
MSGQIPGLRIDKLNSEAALNVLLAVVDVVQSHDCAHNVVFFSDSSGDVSAVVYCRAKAAGVKDAGSVNVAISELSGHVFAKSTEAFERYSADELDSLIEDVRLPDEVYHGICDDVVERVMRLQNDGEVELQSWNQEELTSAPSSLKTEQLVEAVSQLQALRSHLQTEMDFLKKQIGEMKSASEDAKTALDAAAAAAAQQQRKMKDRAPPSDPKVAPPPPLGLNYVLFGMIVLFAAIACHKFFGPLLY